MRRAYTHLVQSKPNFDNAFTFTVQTDDVGISASNQFTLPISGTDDPMQIDWGDDTFQTGVTSAITHTYPVAGLYTIKINNCNRFGFTGGGDRRKMREVSQMGGFRLSVLATFNGCSNMTWTAIDAPIIETTILDATFSNCTLFNGNINSWDVSGVTSFSSFLGNCINFNQPLNNWRFSTGTSLRNMFFLASSFNQDLSSWNIENVNSLERVFYGCSAFNQDISNWNTSNVSNMLGTFQNASSFNQNLSSWNLRTNGVYMPFIFLSSGMSCINYTDTLVSWFNQSKTNSGPLNVNATGQSYTIYATSRSGGVNYVDAGAARTNALETVANGGLGWTIDGGTVQSNC